MRILFWSEFFRPYVGGIEVLASRLVPALSDRGHRFTVITSHGNLDLADEEEIGGTPIHRLPFREALVGRDPAKLARVRQRITRIEEEFRPEIRHLFSIGSSSYFFCPPEAGRSPAIPTLVTLHSMLPQGATAQLDGFLVRTIRAADWVSTCSVQVLEATHRTIPEIRSFSSAILNGVEMPVLKPAPLPFDPPVMLCIGRLSPEKGFDLVVEAFSGVADRYPSARMVLAGDGPDRMALEQRTERLGLAERVMFRGMIPPGRVAEILNEATVVVVPSRREGLGLSAVEAALMARPVVAAEIGGLPEVVLDGRTGLLVRPEDPTSIARAVISLLDDPRRATELGDAARRRALHLFTLARCVDDYDGIYHRLAAASRGGPRVGTEDAIQFTVKS
ncbi:hypothetical protein BH18GEM1_BH18GEM1_06370 [soil metagenome]